MVRRQPSDLPRVCYNNPMLDIRYITNNVEKVKQSAKEKGYHVDIDRLLELDVQRRQKMAAADELREQRNRHASAMKGGRPSPELIAEGRAIKEQVATAEAELAEVLEEYNTLLAQVPNIIFDDVPLGGEEDSVELERVGTIDQHPAAKDHLTYAQERDWVDFARGAKVAGAKFYYLKGDLALLEQALTQYAITFLVQKGFQFMTVPHMVNQRTMVGTGFAPRTSDQSDEYAIEGEDLSLIATAEIPLTGYHADEILNEEALPLFYAGLSPCYRREAGAAGKHTRGLFRVHQFNKVEMYAYTLPEQSQAVHEQLLAYEKELWDSLGVSYRVINIAAGDLGAPAAKKYDIEYWSPVDGAFRELTSCSNCTDFQTQNLNIRVRRRDGSIEPVHSLNGTAVSLARALVVVLESFQQPDGSIRVPEVLVPYLQGRSTL